MKKKIKIEYCPIVEFLYSMIACAYYESNMPMGDVQYKKEVVKEFDSKLSEYMKNELQFFFLDGENHCLGLGQDFIGFILDETEGLHSEEDLIKVMEQMPASKYEEIVKKRLEKLRTVNKEEMKKKYDYVLQYPGEIQTRFTFLLKSFLSNVYQNSSSEFEKKLITVMDAYQAELESDAEAFIRKYHHCNLDAIQNKLTIHISYVMNVVSDLYTRGESDNELLVIGMDIDKHAEVTDPEEEIEQIMKVLGDKSRRKIIKLLHKQSLYVNEIAEKMDMSAPTVSHHLTALQNYEIVEYERREHRLYYYLREDKLDALLEKVKLYFLFNFMS